MTHLPSNITYSFTLFIFYDVFFHKHPVLITMSLSKCSVPPFKILFLCQAGSSTKGSLASRSRLNDLMTPFSNRGG